MQPLHDGAHSPGDRYPLNVCRGKGTVRVLAVAPYTFTFSAPVKGRWLGRPLLNVFAKEFAYIPPVSAENELPRASLDPSVTIPAYIEELRTGLLLLRGREAECRAAGEAYTKELGSLSTSFISFKEEHNKTAERSEEEEASLSSSLLLLPDDAGSPLHTEETDDVMKYFLSAMSPRLLLRQRDVIIHHVLRREAPIACNDPLHVLRYDHVARGSSPRRLLVVRKPHGIPVHPSGCYRKNSVTSILEDVFGGIDAHRYCVVPLNKENMEEEREKEKGGKGREKNSSKKDTMKKCLQPVDGVEYMAICHKKYGFELIRVWVGDGYVTQAAWKELESFLTSSSQQEQKHSRCCLKTFVVHRLDAATSGVLLFGLDSPSARITTELLSRKSNTDETVEETPDVGCAKQYIARVHGRFDVAKLAEGQHHCSYDDSLPTASYSPFVFPSVLPLLTANSAEDCGKNPHWLRVDRPIGCLSYHESLYWCPDAVLTQSWMKEQKEKNEKEKKEKEKEKDQQQQRQREDMSLRNTSAAGRKRAPYTGTAMLEAKHERMRRLTTGGRGGGSTAVDGTKKKSSDETAVDHKTERLKESMKRAITLIRFVAYDAACDESVVECFLLSGRTHQVRVHLASLGHPIRGDKKYIHMAASVLSGSASTSSCSVCSPLNEATMKREEEEEGMREDEGYLMSHGIFLHAWRYTLFYSKDEAPEIFEAPPPACMLTGVVNNDNNNNNNNNNEEEEKAREEKN